jgi:hypothetical protein
MRIFGVKKFFALTLRSEEIAQIEYEDEDPAIHAEFEAALKQAGAQCKMDYHPHCTAK